MFVYRISMSLVLLEMGMVGFAVLMGCCSLIMLWFLYPEFYYFIFLFLCGFFNNIKINSFCSKYKIFIFFYFLY